MGNIPTDSVAEHKPRVRLAPAPHLVSSDEAAAEQSLSSEIPATPVANSSPPGIFWLRPSNASSIFLPPPISQNTELPLTEKTYHKGIYSPEYSDPLNYLEPSIQSLPQDPDLNLYSYPGGDVSHPKNLESFPTPAQNTDEFTNQTPTQQFSGPFEHQPNLIATQSKPSENIKRGKILSEANEKNEIFSPESNLEATQQLPIFKTTDNFEAHSSKSEFFSAKTTTKKDTGPIDLKIKESPEKHVLKEKNHENVDNPFFNEDVDFDFDYTIPISSRINRQLIEQKKLRKSLVFMGWFFSFVILVICTLAGYGGWELWKKLAITQNIAGTLNTQLRPQVMSNNTALADLRQDLQKVRISASELAEKQKIETNERILIAKALQALTIKLEELESGTSNRLRSIALSEAEVQELRRELAQIRSQLSTQSNRTASDISSLTRRIEAIETFLTRATQPQTRQEPQRR